ncbi:MAG TPA: hypothetical protein VNM72_04240 [Blastocatellia bacterium]|nr:hypothetical protein [Blastocatellia bacterium]
MRKLLLLLPLVCGCLAAAQSQEFWEKKEYRQWTERECRKLLDDSPWARSYTLSQVIIEPLSSPSSERAREAAPQIRYLVQLRSAPPVRQALIRLAQIAQGYDRLSVEEQRAFDQKAESFLRRDFSETVVVHVTYQSNVMVDQRDLERHWRMQTTELLKNSVYLISGNGEKVPLLSYAAATDRPEFQLVFPRYYKGRPIATVDDKTIKLEFPHPRIGQHPDARIFLEFKVSRMRVGENIVY